MKEDLKAIADFWDMPKDKDEQIEEWQDSNKSEDDLYFEDISEEQLTVPKLIERLKADGKIKAETYIQIGANSGWYWIGKIDGWETFEKFAREDYERVKDRCIKLQKEIDEYLKQYPQRIPKDRIHNYKYISDYSRAFRIYGMELGNLVDEYRNAMKTYKLGSMDRRKVLEVYTSIQPDKDAVMIHVVGDEKGLFWDVDEVKGAGR